MLVVGIDPGLSGAVAARLPGAVRTYPLPTTHITRNRKERRAFDCHAFSALMEPLIVAGPALIAIEQVGGIAGQGAAAAFNFGFTCGQIHAVAQASGARLVYVAPATWRGALGVHAHARRTGVGGKDASREVASQLWPDDAHQWRRKNQDGHAEAALIAEYAARYIL